MKEMIRLRETLYTYQTKSGLTGPNRTIVAEKCLAAAIAYAAPCFVGEMSDIMRYYRDAVEGTAMKIISGVNEVYIVRTDKVLEDVRHLWTVRYSAINDPNIPMEQNKFMQELTAGDQLATLYSLWIGGFSKSTQAVWDAYNGVE